MVLSVVSSNFIGKIILLSPFLVVSENGGFLKLVRSSLNGNHRVEYNCWKAVECKRKGALYESRHHRRMSVS